MTILLITKPVKAKKTRKLTATIVAKVSTTSEAFRVKELVIIFPAKTKYMKIKVNTNKILIITVMRQPKLKC
jgi:hypothetical protein